MNDLICFARFFSLLLFSHFALDILHDVLHVERNFDGGGHFISIFNAHSKQILHRLEFGLVSCCDPSILPFVYRVLFVDELDYRTRGCGVLGPKNWSNHEVLNIGAGALIIDFLNEFSLLWGVIRKVKFLRLKNCARNSRVGWEIHEFLWMNLSDPLSFLFFSQCLLLFGKSISWLILLLFLNWERFLTQPLLCRRCFQLVASILFVFVIWAWFITIWFSLAIFGGIWICEKLVLLEVVHQNSNSLKAKEWRKRFSHFPEKTFMVPLCANFTRELKSIYNLCLPPLYFFHGISPFKAHLKVETNYFEDLLIRWLETKWLFVSVKFRLTLDNQLDIFFFRIDRLSQELLIFMSVFDIIRLVETVPNLTWLIANSIDHLTGFNHVPLVEKRTIRLLFNPLDAFRIFFVQDKNSNTLANYQAFKLSHS